MGRTKSSILASVLILCSCGSDESAPNSDRVVDLLTSVADTIDAEVRLTFSRSPSRIAALVPHASANTGKIVALPSDLSEGHIADIAAMGNGRFAVLFRDLQTVAVVGADNRVERKFGRRGPGPGELADPVGIAWNGAEFLVMDMDDARPLSLFDSTGTFVRQVRLPMMADWSLAYSKELRLGDDAPYQMGPEDLTRRVSASPSGFMALVGDRRGTRWDREDPTNQRRVVTSFRMSVSDSSAVAVDTLDIGSHRLSTAPIVDRSGKQMPERIKRLVQPLYESRALITGSDLWEAVYRPTNATITVTYAAGAAKEASFRVTWAERALSPVTDSIAMVGALEFHQIAARNNAGVDRLWRESSAQRRHEILKISKSLLTFADSLSEVSALFSGRRCLWIVPTSVGDYVDGTGLVLIGVDAQAKRLGGVVRVGDSGRRLRDIDDEFAYLTHRTENGEFILERIPLPPACAASVSPANPAARDWSAQ